MIKNFSFVTVFVLLSATKAFSQCAAGEVNVSINVMTDMYGYEAYWQLVPAGNECGIGTIAFGGNTAVGCSGAGDEQQTPGGYGNHVTVTEGPWCLQEDSAYTIIYTDDWGDGGTHFTVLVDGYPMYSELTGSGGAPSGTALTFNASLPLTNDIGILDFTMPLYVGIGATSVEANVFNYSSTTVTGFTFNYNVNGGITQTETVNGLSIAPFTTYHYVSSSPLAITSNGSYAVVAWVSDPNGAADMLASNDSAFVNVEAGPPVPNLISQYVNTTPERIVVATAADSLKCPRDLDFHPVLTRNELWVVNAQSESYGGTTVTLYNAGTPNQTALRRKDQNSWHFMSLPTAIAFSDNGNFGTSPAVLDANHGTGEPFTGPSLWNSDSLVYAQPSGGNGSHIDMLHESPRAMGICSVSDNAFWVYDGYHNAPVYYDFANDHGPGNDDHSDGIIRRYEGLGLTPDPTFHVASHLILDKSTDWLYIVDTGNDRVVRMNTTTGMAMANLTPHEPVAEYTQYDMVDWEVVSDTGLSAPSGIELMDNRLLVSDYATGDIVVYDISGSPFEMGRIHTNDPGIMGIKIGPDGKLWYVNTDNNEVVRLDPMQALPQAAFSASQTEVCIGGCVQFSSQSTDATSYQWTFNNGSDVIIDTTSEPAAVCYTASGTYSATLVVANSVGSDTVTLIDFLTVHPAPAQPTVAANNNWIFVASDYMSYQWFLDGNAISGADSSAYEATESGAYYVVVADAFGCTATSTSFNVTTTGLTALNSDESTTVYPNPSNGSVNITSTKAFHLIELVDVSGRVVLTEITGTVNETTVNVEHLNAGAYLMKLHSSDCVSVQRLDIVR